MNHLVNHEEKKKENYATVIARHQQLWHWDENLF